MKTREKYIEAFRELTGAEPDCRTYVEFGVATAESRRHTSTHTSQSDYFRCSTFTTVLIPPRT